MWDHRLIMLPQSGALILSVISLCLRVCKDRLHASPWEFTEDHLVLLLWLAHYSGILLNIAGYWPRHPCFTRFTISLWATVAPHAPPGGFSETTIFMILTHIAIETRVPAKILMLDKAVRALFSKWLPKRCKCYNFIILKQICFIFNHCLEQKEYRIVQIWIIFHQLSQDGVFFQNGRQNTKI